MTVLGRGLLGLPVDTDSILIGVSGVLDELPVGSLGEVLTVTGSGVDWAASAAGTLTQVDTGIGLTGGPITTTGTIDLDVSSLPSLVGVPSISDEIVLFDVSSSTHTKTTISNLDAAIGPNVLDDLTDVTVGNPPGAGQDGFVLAWNNGAGEFQLVAPAGGSVTEAFKTFAGDTGTAVADAAADTLTIAGGEVIVTAAQDSPDAITIALDITNTTALGGAPDGSDELVIYDVSAGTHKKVTVGSLPTGGGGEANTASNLGTGIGVFDSKLGIDLQFNSILGNEGVDATLNGNDIELDLDITGLSSLGGAPDLTDELVVYDVSGSTHVKITVSDLPFLEAANNLSDVANSQTAIDNLTTTNLVTVDQLKFVDHDPDGQNWLIEEDGTGSSNALTFDYGGTERIRFTTTGGALFRGVTEIDGTGTGELKLSNGATIIDTNDNTILAFSEDATAVNAVEIHNASSGSRPKITNVGTDTAGAGTGLEIEARDATTTGVGGRLLFTSGNGFDTGAGGQIDITSGTGGGTSGNGGRINITAGSSLGGADGDGGRIVITSGSNLGVSGDVGDAGNIELTSGSSVDGDGGDVLITAGTGADASTSSNFGGSIVLTPGDGTGGATDGTIQLRNVSGTTIIETGNQNINMLPFGAASGNTTEIRFYELAANGQNYVGFKAPNSIASNEIWVLPNADGASGEVLTTDGAGNLSWTASGGTGTVTSVGTGVGLTGGPITTSGTIDLDIIGLTLESSLQAVDSIAIYDNSVAAHRRTTLGDLTTFLGAATSLNDLTDVTSPTPSEGDYLRFTSGLWRDEPLSIADDSTPQLGGNLDVNGFSITSTSNGDIFITPDGAGNIVLDGLIWPSADGTSGQALVTDGSGNLSFATISGGGGNTFTDDVFRILDDGDNSKEIAFQASAITTSTTRTITMPDQDIDLTPDSGSFIKNIVADISPQLGGNLDVQSFDIITSTTNGDITITPDGTGSVVLGTAGSATLQADDESNLTIGGGDSIGSGDGGDTIITSGDGITSFASGDIFLTPGTGGASNGSVIIDGLIWPSIDGTSGQVLTTDGSGNLSFSGINLITDLSPQLGGNLDVNGFEITSVSNGDVVVNPNGTGQFEVGGIFYSKRQTQAIADNTTAVFLSYTAASNEATFVDYGLIRSGDGSRVGTLMIINDGSSVSIADTGTDISDAGVTFSAVVNGANIDVSYTSTSTGNAGTMSYSVRQWDV